MTIQFRCTQCDKLLSAPDDAAGKQAKCPNCSALSPIPGTIGAFPSQSSPLPSMSTLPPKPEPAGAPGGPANPFADVAGGTPFKPSPATLSNNPYATSGTFAPEVPSFGAPGELRPTQVSFDQLWNSTYSIFNQRLGPCVLFGLLMIAANFGINIVANVVQQVAQATKEQAVIIGALLVVQVVSFLFQTFIQMAGATFMIRLARDGQAGFETVSAVAPAYLRGLLVTFAVALCQGFVIAIGVIPGAIIGAVIQPPEGAIFGGLAGMLIALIPAIVVGLSLYLSLYFVIDRNMGVIESMQASMTHMRGNRLTVLGAGIVLGFLGLLVIIFTCFIGILVVIPFMQLFNAVVYLHITGQKTFDLRPQPTFGT